ncbi:16152_t:CDS:2 [Cetraspora pellucida]|uniref:16152_t:CDS:1 n=1 Tax=Cetraspora pellucida TaxID=1433469 RepID=A0A9N9JFH8_9GLOM|nr:16152_t:CDS:2 [Cetraspora pellucida]
MTTQTWKLPQTTKTIPKEEMVVTWVQQVEESTTQLQLTQDIKNIEQKLGKVQRSSRKDGRSLKETSNELRSQTKFGGSISEAIDLTETEQPCQPSIELSG